MDENLYKKISNALDDVLDLKGTIICYNGQYIDIDKDELEVSVKIEEFDKHMIAYVIAKVAGKKAREVPLITWILAAVFVFANAIKAI